MRAWQTPNEGGLVSESTRHPYVTHLDIKCPALSKVHVPGLVAACADRWYNQAL